MNFHPHFGFGMYCNKGPGGAVEKQWVCRSRSALDEGRTYRTSNPDHFPDLSLSPGLRLS